VDSTRKIDPAGLIIAGLLAVTAAVIYWDTTKLEISPLYGLGPKAMPIVVASGLALLALGNLVMGLRGNLPARESADPRAITLILGGLAALIALIHFNGGFIAATAVLFMATSAAFGRRAYLVDLAIGFALGVVIYLMFDKLLTLSLPAGPLEHQIDWLWNLAKDLVSRVFHQP
jgi:putative tricarboxylic transport membrane protein